MSRKARHSLQPARLQLVDDWFAKRRVHIVIGIILASAGLRATYFWQLNQGPCIWQHRWADTDMNFFHHWATEIVQGDFLTDQALHPYHTRHASVAEQHLAEHADLREELAAAAAAAGSAKTPGQLLWDRWYGGKQFHQEPLYPYLVAATFKVCGTDVRWVFAWQLLLGICTNLLIFEITRRCFGDAAATLAGLGAVLCCPLMSYELMLLRETLRTFTCFAVVYCTLVAVERRTTKAWFILGLVLGCALLVKTTIMLYALGLVCAMALIYHRQASAAAHHTRPWAAVRPVLVLGAGMALALLPLVVRNVVVGCPPLSMSSGGAVGLIMSNAVDAKAGFGGIEHLAEIMARTEGRSIAVLIETLKTHPSIASFLGQLGVKFSRVWHWYEAPDNTNIYYYRLQAPILRWMPVSFLVAAPLGLLGLVLSLRAQQTCWPVHLLAINEVVLLVLFACLSRYRVPLLVILIITAAGAFVQLLIWIRDRRWAPTIAALCCAAIVGTAIYRPLSEMPQPRPRSADYFAPFQYYYYPRAEQAAQSKDWVAAAGVLIEALAYEPQEVRRLGPQRLASNQYEAELAGVFGSARLRCAEYLRAAGQEHAAQLQVQRFAELKTAVRR